MKPVFPPRSRVFPVPRWIVIVVVTLAALAALAAVAVPGWLKSTLESQIPQQTGRQFKVEKVAFNPFTLRVTLVKLQLLEADNAGVAFSADSLSVRLSYASLYRIAPVIGEIVLTRPQLHLLRSMRDGKDETNFSDVIRRMQQKPSTGQPLRYAVSNLQLQDGELDLDDRIAAKKMHIAAINLGVPFLSTFPSAQDVFVEPSLSAKVDGSLIELKGRSKPFSESEETSLAIDIDHFHLNELTAFAPHLLPFSVRSAILTTRLNLTFHAQKERQTITLSGEAGLDDVALDDGSGAPLYASRKIRLNLADADLLAQRFDVNQLEVSEPQIWVGLDQKGALNWAALQGEEKAPDNKAPSKPAMLELKNLTVKNGTLHWRDASRANPAFSLDLANIALDVQNLSNHPKAKPAKVIFSAGNNRQLQFEGEVTADQAIVSGRLGLADIALQDYQPYFNSVVTAGVSGKFALQSTLDVRPGNVALHDLSASVEDFAVQATHLEDGTLKAKKIAVAGVTVDSAARQIAVDQILLDQIQAQVIRDGAGEINLTHLLKKTPARAAATTPTPVWQADVRKVAMTGSGLRFADQSVQPAVLVNADDVALTLENISSKMDSPVKVGLRATLNKTGQFNLDGTATGQNAQLNLDVSNFAMATLQPYFTQFLNIQISTGSISTRSALKWTAPAQVNFQGGVKVANLVTTDKANAADFLRWKMLDVSGISVDLGGKQSAITLGKINLNDFYARAILSEKGKLNLQEIMVQARADGKKAGVGSDATPDVAPAVPNGSAAKLPPIISIGAITLSNGVVNYTDNFIQPHYSMKMTGVQGSVGAMRSDLAQPAGLNLSGKVDDEAPMAISGSLNPLFAPLLLDIKLTASGIDLPRLTTYALKYAGYPIVKGELSMDVDYHVRDSQLSANNTLVIDQLTFGDRVEGPNATHLPVSFLISLLTDTDGKINLNLPISGTLNDPQFSIGGLIARVFLDMIEKVVTSPFALLAHSFGHTSGGDELAYIEFDPGSASLTQASKAKLDSIAEALAKRPALQLDITGRADMSGDAGGLRRRMLEHQIRRSLHPDDQSADSVITPAERAHALDQIYSAAKFAKPRNAIGIAKTLPGAEMENLLITNTQIGEDEIRNLALRREAAVHVYLTDVTHVAPQRLYSIAPKLSGEGITDKGATARVDLDLKM